MGEFHGPKGAQKKNTKNGRCGRMNSYTIGKKKYILPGKHRKVQFFGGT